MRETPPWLALVWTVVFVATVLVLYAVLSRHGGLSPNP